MSDLPGASAAGAPGDLLVRVVDDIESEARRIRATGVVPGGFEDDLRRRFRRIVPGQGRRLTRLRQAVSAVDRSAAIDLAVPLGSRIPGGGPVKQLIHRLLGWYVAFFVVQLHRAVTSLAAAVRALAEDIEQTGAAVDRISFGAGLRGGPDGSMPGLPVPADEMPWWADEVIGLLADATGPVLHARCGTGRFSAALRDRGVEVLGAEPDRELAGAASRRGVEVVVGRASEQLAATADDSLGGLVLEVLGHELQLDERARLLELAPDRLRSGGRIVIPSTTPEAWARTISPVIADLVPSRPLHPETWVHLLSEAGFVDCRILRGGSDRRIAVGDAMPEGVADLVGTLNDVIGGPDGYVVVASAP